MNMSDNYIKEEELEPITKDSLIAGYLTMFKLGALREDLTISEIKKVVEDKRIDWK